MDGCFENPFANDTSLDPRPLPSLHMRRRCSALSVLSHYFLVCQFRGGSYCLNIDKIPDTVPLMAR